MASRLIRALISGAVGSAALMITSNLVIAETQIKSAPKNIIMVVADGMGPAYTSAYRYYNDTDLSDGVSPTIFDRILVGNASTYPAAESGIVTDSAAGATALSAGVKTYNGAIAMDANRKPVNTVLREAKRLGMRTGLAVTSQIVHATPAAYVTHNESRKNYNDIANQFFDDRIDGKFVVDVMLGGGTSYFEREDRDIIAQFIDAGYQYTDSYNKLATYSAGQNLLGLFAPVGLPWALDDRRKHRLAYLTQHAVKHLENEAGFFLLIEASQVDWAGHATDIASAMAEMDDLAQTMGFLDQYVKEHPDTLVVLTADHSTGGMTIGANGDYKWEPSYLKAMTASPDVIAKRMTEIDNPAGYVEESVGFALTNDEKRILNAVAEQDDVKVRAGQIKALLDTRSNTGWTSTGHTGIDVQVFAMGPNAFLFAGGQDNTNIAKTLFSLLDARKRFGFSAPTVSREKQKQKPVKKGKADKNAEEESSDELCNFKEDWHC